MTLSLNDIEILKTAGEFHGNNVDESTLEILKQYEPVVKELLSGAATVIPVAGPFLSLALAYYNRNKSKKQEEIVKGISELVNEIKNLNEEQLRDMNKNHNVSFNYLSKIQEDIKEIKDTVQRTETKVGDIKDDTQEIKEKLEDFGRKTAIQNGIKAEGRLRISDIIVHQDKESKTCLLDFRVNNTGGSDVLVNHVVFEVLEVKTFLTSGFMEFSKTYDLDISQLEQKGDTMRCVISQHVRPGEIDRFGIILIAIELGTGVFRGWKLRPTLCTNFGNVSGNPVDVWLPYDLLRE